MKAKKTFCFAALALALTVSAADQEANTFFSQGRDREKEANYRKAASRYMDAHLMADSSILRGNALIAAARAYRKAKLYGEEFDCLERLIKEHLTEINFSQIVGREYQIGDLFFAGHRDLVVSWIPFIKEKDRTMEIYEAALKNAPCHEHAGEVRLRLARLYIDDQKPDDAVRHLREIPKLHPGTPSAKYAMLELCSLLYQMAERGDGDNSYSRRTIEACDDYLKAFPDTPEIPWVQKTRQKALNSIAARIHAVGNYYYRAGKPELAEKYLAEVVRNYSNTEQAAASEKLLAQVDEEFEVPPGAGRRYRPVKELIRRHPIPQEDSPIMVTPEHSGGRWLLPVRNLKKSPAVSTDELSPEEYDRFRHEAELLTQKEKLEAAKSNVPAEAAAPTGAVREKKLKASKSKAPAEAAAPSGSNVQENLGDPQADSPEIHPYGRWR